MTSSVIKTVDSSREKLPSTKKNKNPLAAKIIRQLLSWKINWLFVCKMSENWEKYPLFIWNCLSYSTIFIRIFKQSSLHHFQNNTKLITFWIKYECVPKSVTLFGQKMFLCCFTLPSRICTFASVTVDLTAGRPQPNSQRNTTCSPQSLSVVKIFLSLDQSLNIVFWENWLNTILQNWSGGQKQSLRKALKGLPADLYLRRPQVVGQKTLCSRAAEQKVSVCAQLSPGGTERPAVAWPEVTNGTFRDSGWHECHALTARRNPTRNLFLIVSFHNHSRL